MIIFILFGTLQRWQHCWNSLFPSFRDSFLRICCCAFYILFVFFYIVLHLCLFLCHFVLYHFIHGRKLKFNLRFRQTALSSITLKLKWHCVWALAEITFFFTKGDWAWAWKRTPPQQRTFAEQQIEYAIFVISPNTVAKLNIDVSWRFGDDFTGITQFVCSFVCCYCCWTSFGRNWIEPSGLRNAIEYLK